MESRSKALSHLRKSLRSGRGEDLPMQKVSVMAADEKGLEEGLEKAKELLPKISEMGSKMKEESESHEKCEEEGCKMCYGEKEEAPKSEESSEESSENLDEMSPEELKAMVKSLKSRLNY